MQICRPFRDGSDGTRARDLRHDRPFRRSRRLTTTRAGSLFMRFSGFSRFDSAWLSEAAPRGLLPVCCPGSTVRRLIRARTGPHGRAVLLPWNDNTFEGLQNWANASRGADATRRCFRLDAVIRRHPQPMLGTQPGYSTAFCSAVATIESTSSGRIHRSATACSAASVIAFVYDWRVG